MATFDVRQWLQQYQTGASRVTMSRPEQVTCWTKTGGKFLFEDESGLPTYVRPQLPVDLNVGFTTNYTPKAEGERSPVDTIIQAAAKADVEWSHFDVCTYRNNMNKVLLTPIQKEWWDMECCYHGASGTLFLDIVPGQQATFKDADKFTYYGYHFEAVCTGGGRVDATSEFGIVVTYRLGQLRMLMAAEIDAQQPGGAPGPEGGAPYVEMKTYNIPRHNRAAGDMYSVKHPRWWVQSYLAGVPTLVLGGRDQQGTLLKVQEVPVQALPGLSAHAGHPWDADKLLAFGEAVLAWLKGVASQHPNKQLHVYHDPGSGSIHCEGADSDMPQRLAQLVSLSD